MKTLNWYLSEEKPSPFLSISISTWRSFLVFNQLIFKIISTYQRPSPQLTSFSGGMLLSTNSLQHVRELLSSKMLCFLSFGLVYFFLFSFLVPLKLKKKTWIEFFHSHIVGKLRSRFWYNDGGFHSAHKCIEFCDCYFPYNLLSPSWYHIVIRSSDFGRGHPKFGTQILLLLLWVVFFWKIYWTSLYFIFSVYKMKIITTSQGFYEDLKS